MKGPKRTRRDRPLATGDLLSGTALRALSIRSRRHELILGELRKALPETLGAHCQACVDRDDTLVVFTDGSAWATQLRFTIPSRLAELSARFGGSWTRCQVRIAAPPRALRQARGAPPRIPDAHAADALAVAAETIDSDPLRDALLRLSATWRALRR